MTDDTKRLKGLERVLRLQRCLAGLHYCPSLETLAAEFAVSTRTIRRDLELLERVGLKVPQYRWYAFGQGYTATTTRQGLVDKVREEQVG
jgi:predicted DNA-binding transcriptional regulator YafY